MYPSNFAWLLNRSYTEIKRANPSATVISGGLFSFDGGSGADYLQQTYTQGRALAGWSPAGAPLDAVGQHVYVDQGGATSPANISRVLDEVRGAYTAAEPGRPSLQTHVTEVGWRSDTLGVQVQASNLRTAYQVFGNTRYVARAYWFVVRDTPGQAAYGLADEAGVPKPAFQAYQTYAK